jgi:SAM-dependent methyltransferase
MRLRDVWETRAPEWVRWARSPELDDDFWGFHLHEFMRFVPAPGRLTVDVGCGEGRLGRELAAAGHRVVGVDASLTSARAAAAHPQGHPVVVADASRLPFRGRAADLAVAFMSLHDFDDLPGAIAEAARVLTVGGQLCVALLHPVLSARMVDGYAAEQRYRFTVGQGEVQMTYEGTHRPLRAYLDAFEAAGLVLEALREPVAMGEDGAPSIKFLHLRGRLAGGAAKRRPA